MIRSLPSLPPVQLGCLRAGPLRADLSGGRLGASLKCGSAVEMISVHSAAVLPPLQCSFLLWNSERISTQVLEVLEVCPTPMCILLKLLFYLIVLPMYNVMLGHQSMTQHYLALESMLLHFMLVVSSPCLNVRLYSQGISQIHRFKISDLEVKALQVEGMPG
jgi:hypothetical protein